MRLIGYEDHAAIDLMSHSVIHELAFNWDKPIQFLPILLEPLSVFTLFLNREVCKELLLENPNAELSPLKQTW